MGHDRMMALSENMRKYRMEIPVQPLKRSSMAGPPRHQAGLQGFQGFQVRSPHGAVTNLQSTMLDSKGSPRLPRWYQATLPPFCLTSDSTRHPASDSCEVAQRLSGCKNPASTCPRQMAFQLELKLQSS